jgi:DNA modification methylase
MGALDQVVTDQYAIFNGDCVEVMREFPDGSAHASVYSLPFARPGGANPGLYHYSSSDRDLSNSRSYEEFLQHYAFVVAGVERLTMPGRISGVHCMDVPAGNSGGDALADFPGDLIRLHLARGFDYLGRHVIWKEPLAVRNRTMVKDLTHQTTVEDSTLAGIASADYLLIFRKRGDNPVPVTHPNGFTTYHGASRPPADVLRYQGWTGNQIENKYSQWVWRQYASCVWDDIRGNLGQYDDRSYPAVLPYREARDEEDEKHVHALQLDVIRRFVDMRTNPGETVWTPFMGVGSEVYAAVELGRPGLGAELKPSYYRQAVKNLREIKADHGGGQASLLDDLGALSEA